MKKGQLDIVPLIDVVFLLLIFFMLTSSFVTQPGIKINLPRAVTSEAILEKNLIITITESNVIYLNQQAIELKELLPRLKQAADEGKSLLIKADRKMTNASLVTFMFPFHSQSSSDSWSPKGKRPSTK